MRTFVTLLVSAVFAAPVLAQPEPPKPGPEHVMLKKREGTWAVVMKAEGAEFKGTATYKMELGDLWLTSTVEVDMGGMKFSGRGLDTYEAKTKTFHGVWADNMIAKPMTFQGTYDAKEKTITSTADAPGPDGKPAKWKTVDTHIDDDTFDFKMYLNDGKEPAFTITYKRKK